MSLPGLKQIPYIPVAGGYLASPALAAELNAPDKPNKGVLEAILTMNDPDHHSLVQILAEMSSTLAASECHGLASGLLCSSPTQKAKARWFSELLDSTGLAGEGAEAELAVQTGNLKLLDELFEHTVEALNSADLSFQVLLPAESENLQARVDALAGWCSGFCAGVGFTVSAERELPEDTRELLADFSAISRAGVGADDELEPEDDEASFIELEEYVRMGTLLICEELQPAGNASAKVH